MNILKFPETKENGELKELRNDLSDLNKDITGKGSLDYV